MIELYTAATGNGHRAAIAVAESQLAFTVRCLDLAANEQNEPWYRAINPRCQIPTIIDHDGPGGKAVTVTQSGAIMLYLAEKTGSLPADTAMRTNVMQHFMHVCTDIAGINATLTLSTREGGDPGQATLRYFESLLMRHFTAINRELESQPYLAGSFSIADLALYPHVVRRREWIEAARLDHLLGWKRRLDARPGVQVGMRLSVQSWRKS